METTRRIVIALQTHEMATNAQRVEMSPHNGVETAVALAERVELGVVRLNVRRRSSSGHGSGFVVDRQTIVTNYHVVEGVVSVEAVFRDGSVIPVRGLLTTDPAADLATLKVDAIPPSAKPLSLSDALPRKGETVLAFGSPKGLDFFGD